MATQIRRPTSNGSCDMSYSAGTSAIALVGEDSPDDDTTYVTTNTGWGNQICIVGNDVFDITSTAITKVTAYARMRYVSFAPTGMVNALRIGAISLSASTGYVGASFHASLTSSYQNMATDWLTNPSSGVDWTEGEIERSSGSAKLWGQHIRGANSAGTTRGTQMWLEVTYTEASTGSTYYYQMNQ